MPDTKASATAKTPLHKLAAIPVLFVILLYVVWPAGEGEPEIGLTDEAQAELAAAGDERAGSGGPNAKEPHDVATRPLPELSLREILAHNPFETPHALDPEPEVDPAIDLEKEAAEKAEEDKQAQLGDVVATLKQNGVSMIFEGKSGRMALVGTQLVKEGDMLTENLRVLRIDDKGLVLSVVESVE